MAEHLNQTPHPASPYASYDPTSGFNAMGLPVPPERMGRALAHVREMAPGINTEQATALVGRVAEALERDEPYQAQAEGMRVLDLTGTYRLMAVLLT
jgi:hypothetical protein